jgi:hypothetical protein
MKQRASARRAEPAIQSDVPVRLARAEAPPPAAPAPGAGLGVLAGLGSAGEAWVDLPRQRRSRVPARSTLALLPEHVGREVLLTWIEGEAEPIITGLIRLPSDAEREAAAPRAEVVIDAERIVLTGKREVVLRCGAASILLAADGSVVIKGARMLSSASGVHRIRGGAVQIN